MRVWAAGLALAIAAACGGDAQAGDPVDATGAPESFTRIINVEVATVGPETFVERIRLTGTVEANRDVTISAEESGTIVELLVEKGQRVAAGDSILRIDDRLLRAQFQEAEARAALAAETWQRRKRLWEEDRVGSELAYLEARYTADQAAASLATLERRLERTVVLAPIEGILDDRMVELGTLVSPGTPVARIVDLDPVKIVGGVPERYAADVRRGAAAVVGFDVLPDENFEGRVGFVGSAVDPRNRTFPIELLLRNPGGVMKPEMVANISVVRRSFENAIVVDQDAIVRKAEGYAVFVIQGPPDALTAEMRPVDVGASQGDRVVIRSGLVAGDRLVVVGQQQVADGDRVRIVAGGGQ
jgi:RND family efflux transporter MFP subunit